jgi:hypothetical protein
METDGLFSLASPGGVQVTSSAAAFTPPSADSPLPVRMRPASLDELVGQEHLLAAGSPLRQLVTGASPMSVILWGPPGTGKTTIAHLVAAATNRKFVAMSALSAGVKDVRAVIDTARRERRHGGPPTVLFIDEVHRFSKTQQDSLLAAVEDRTVTLLAATTENPYFSVISPLLSRCVLLTLQALGDDDVRAWCAARSPTSEGWAVPSRSRRGRGPSRTPGVGRRAQGADRARGGRRRRLRPRAARDRPGHRGEGGRRRGRALRPGRRRALRRDQRVHQEHARQRPGRGAALAGPHAGGRRGPAVHRPAHRHLRQRGRRHGRPAGPGRGSAAAQACS